MEWLLVLPDRVVWVSGKLLICDFHAQQSLEFAENVAKNKKQQVSSSYVGKNTEGPAWKATEMQITMDYNSAMQTSISEHAMH